jgi:V/A-type H+-transporting ATPase subunit E
MSQQLQDLIDKIKKEGIQEAQDLSRGIEEQAHKKAQEIIAQAKGQAQKILSDAQAQQQKLADVTHMALKQAARDTLLNLHKEIDAILQRIIARNIEQALTSENLAGIIKEAVRGYLQNASLSQNVDVVVSHKDLKALQGDLMAQLKDQIKQPIILKSNDDVGAGFTISFDSGKSFFDFTDVSLAQYLSGSVKAELAALLKESIAV